MRTARTAPRRRVYRSDISPVVGGGVVPRPERGRRRRAGAGIGAWLRRWGLHEMFNRSIRRSDLTLLVIVVTLLAAGVLMVYSSNVAEWRARAGSNLAVYFRLQMRWVVIGLMVMFFFWRVRYTFWRRMSVPMMGVTALLLLSVLIFGEERFGARRALMDGSIQPSEIAKLAVVIYMADWMASKGEKLRELGYGLVPFALFLGPVAGLVAMQKISTAILLVVTAIGMFFVAGADGKQLGIAGGAAGVATAFVISMFQHGRERIATFLQVWRNPLEGDAPHMAQFITCLRSGGLLGKGLGNGTANDSMFLPHSDSIFAVIGEEFGFLGALGVVLLFLWLAYRGTKIAWRAGDSYGMLLAFGTTTWIVLQAFIHIGVVTATIPTTGIPLPFISYGGTALVMAMAGVGLLLSVSCGSADEGEDQGARADLRGRDWRSRLPGAGRS